MKRILTALLCVFASTAIAQVGDYMGPGILSRGAGDIGNSNGQQLNIRFYVTAEGVYDTGLAPFAVDAHGNLLRINGLYGEQLDFGIFGSHSWRTAKLGLDYRGDIYNYANGSAYDGSSHNLTLGYSIQKSKRLELDMRVVAGTTDVGYGVPGYYGNGGSTNLTNLVGAPGSVLFDNRMYYLQGTMDATYIQSARTSFTVGGDGFAVRRQGSGLADVNGYQLRGSVQHRLTKTKTLGVSYERIHFDFPPVYGQSDVNVFEGIFSTALGRRWTLNVTAGAFQAEVEGVRQVALSPVIAALLGTSTGSQAFYSESISPSGTLHLSGRYRTSTFALTGGRTIMPGNGLYLTSSQSAAQGTYSYTAARKWNVGVSGGYVKLDGIGQSLQAYGSGTAGAGFTYKLTRLLNVVGRYDYRRQTIKGVGYLESGSRVTFGLSLSPGNIPLSLW